MSDADTNASSNYDTTTTRYVYQNGQIVSAESVSKSPIKDADKRTQKEKNKDKRKEYLAKLGIYKAFLKNHPDIEALITEAMTDFKNGKPMSDERFQYLYSKTEFAKSRNKAEEEFDLGMGGANADTYTKKVEDTKTSLMQQASRLGVALSDDQAGMKALEIVRSNLTQPDIDGWWETQFGMSLEGADSAADVMTGTSAEIQSRLMDMAQRWGVKLDENKLNEKTGMALGQGERWQEWLQGQENTFREQAKIMYPSIADRLDVMSLADIVEPYFSDAASILGVSTSTMDLTDPKWTRFLTGENGTVATRDEWERMLKTDPKYGWDQTTKARQDYAGLGDRMLAAFGKA
jgi:hypothetical protein